MDAHAEDEVGVRGRGRLGHVLGLRLGVERDAEAELELARERARSRAVAPADLVVDGHAVGARLLQLGEVPPRVVDHQVAVEARRRAAWPIGAIPRSTTGPIVIGGTKCPSPTSKWKMRTPARQQHLDLVAEPGEVGRVERRLHLDRCGSSRPSPRRTILRSAQAGDEEPLVRCTCGSVSRNSGRRGCAKRGHSSPSGSTSRPGRVDDLLVLGRVDRADRVDDRPAGPDALAAARSSASWSSGSGSARQRRSGRRASTPRPEQGASTSARSNPRAPAGARARPPRRPRRSSRRAARRSPRSSRARPALISTATTSPASASPCRRARRRGRASARPRASRRRRRRAGSRRSAARPAPRRAPPRRPARRAARPGRPDRLRPSTSPRDEPDDESRRLVLRPHQRERVLAAELAPPRRRATQSGYECLSAACSGVPRGARRAAAAAPRRAAAAPRS